MTDDFKRTESILYNYKKFDTLNKIALARINQLKNDITLQAISYEERTGPTYKISSSVENEAIRREEHTHREIKKLELEIEQRKYQKEMIDNILELMEDEDKKLISIRYFTKPRPSWVSIGQYMNQSSDNCIKRRRELINLINREYKLS